MTILSHISHPYSFLHYSFNRRKDYANTNCEYILPTLTLLHVSFVPSPRPPHIHSDTHGSLLNVPDQSNKLCTLPKSADTPFLFFFFFFFHLQTLIYANLSISYNTTLNTLFFLFAPTLNAKFLLIICKIFAARLPFYGAVINENRNLFDLNSQIKIKNFHFARRTKNGEKKKERKKNKSRRLIVVVF